MWNNSNYAIEEINSEFGLKLTGHMSQEGALTVYLEAEKIKLDIQQTDRVGAAMTPENKSKQLVGKMYGMTYSQRIANSLVAIEETIQTLGKMPSQYALDECGYWQKVKQELLKLK